jgi:hypothetical protein
MSVLPSRQPRLRSFARKLSLLPFLALAAGAAVSTAADAANCPAIVVPAYFGSNALWQTMDNSPGKEVVIMNPSNGPGSRSNPNYVAEVNAAKASGITVIGYIPTGSGSAAVSTVTSQAQKYAKWYGVTGFFLDEVSASTKKLSTYQSYVSSLDAAYNNPLIMLNPGTVPASGYLGLGSNTQVVVYEGPVSQFNPNQFPSWLQPYFPRSVIITYSSNATQMDTTVSYAKSNGFAGVFAASAGLPNPYGTLPSYFSSEGQATGCSR